MRRIVLLETEEIWRIISHLWTWSFLIFIVFNFFSRDLYDFIAAPFSILYVGVLTLYVGTKEFDRWHKVHGAKQHPGELYVVVWTVVMFFLIIAGVVLGKDYMIHSDIIASYIAVLSIFAVTQKAKKLYREREQLEK